MILYSHLVTRLQKDLVQQDLSKVRADLVDLVLVSDALLAKTKGTGTDVEACKFINAVFMEFMLDTSALLDPSNSKLRDALDLPLFKQLVSDLVLISENDGTTTPEILRTYNQRLHQFRTVSGY